MNLCTGLLKITCNPWSNDFVSRANINTTEPFGRTAIYFASKDNDYVMVKTLVQLNSNIELQDDNSENPFTSQR